MNCSATLTEATMVGVTCGTCGCVSKRAWGDVRRRKVFDCDGCHRRLALMLDPDIIAHVAKVKAAPDPPVLATLRTLELLENSAHITDDQDYMYPE